MSQDTSRPKRRRVLVIPVQTKTGYQTAGGTARNEGSANANNAVKVVLAAGTYDSITAYIDWNLGNRTTNFGLYNDVAGVPTTLQAQSVVPGVDLTQLIQPGWVTLQFTAPVTLAAGTYWIAVAGQTGASNAMDWWYDAGSAGDSYTGGSGFSTVTGFPTTWTGGASDSKKFSAYVNASYVFTPPYTPIKVWVTLVGGGAGGGGAARGTGNTTAGGGGGAGEAVFRHPYYIASGTIFAGVGLGGIGGAGRTGSTGNGTNGTNGSPSRFGTILVRAGVGGSAAQSGSNNQGAGGASGGGTAGGAAGNQGSDAVAGANLNPFFPGGGGGGGSSNNGVNAKVGGFGGCTVLNMAVTAQQGQSATNHGNDGIGGASGGVTANDEGGGGGGGGSLLGFGGAGGAGPASGAVGAAGNPATGIGAGGGGAGGNALANANSNAGGAGADGVVIVEWDE